MVQPSERDLTSIGLGVPREEIAVMAGLPVVHPFEAHGADPSWRNCEDHPLQKGYGLTVEAGADRWDLRIFSFDEPEPVGVDAGQFRRWVSGVHGPNTPHDRYFNGWLDLCNDYTSGGLSVVTRGNPKPYDKPDQEPLRGQAFDVYVDHPMYRSNQPPVAEGVRVETGRAGEQIETVFCTRIAPTAEDIMARLNSLTHRFGEPDRTLLLQAAQEQFDGMEEARAQREQLRAVVSATAVDQHQPETTSRPSRMPSIIPRVAALVRRLVNGR